MLLELELVPSSPYVSVRLMLGADILTHVPKRTAGSKVAVTHCFDGYGANITHKLLRIYPFINNREGGCQMDPEFFSKMACEESKDGGDDEAPKQVDEEARLSARGVSMRSRADSKTNNSDTTLAISEEARYNTLIKIEVEREKEIFAMWAREAKLRQAERERKAKLREAKRERELFSMWARVGLNNNEDDATLRVGVTLASTMATAINPEDKEARLSTHRRCCNGIRLMDLLGSRGSFGHVYKALRYNMARDSVVAVKVVVHYNNSFETWERMRREINVLTGLDSRFIAKYLGCFTNESLGRETWIVMEYCDGGSVADIIEARGGEGTSIPEECIRAICAGMALGLEYLHRMANLCHRNIKCANVLLTSNGLVKLADFGMIDPFNKQGIGNAMAGSLLWMAPEVIQGLPADGRADIWSFGVTVIEMAEGAPPPSNLNALQAAMREPSSVPVVAAPTLAIPSKWSSEMLDFVIYCCQMDPALRLETAVLSTHPFIKAEASEAAALRRGNRRSRLARFVRNHVKLHEESTPTVSPWAYTHHYERTVDLRSTSSTNRKHGQDYGDKLSKVLSESEKLYAAVDSCVKGNPIDGELLSKLKLKASGDASQARDADKTEDIAGDGNSKKSEGTANMPNEEYITRVSYPSSHVPPSRPPLPAPSFAQSAASNYDNYGSDEDDPVVSVALYNYKTFYNLGETPHISLVASSAAGIAGWASCVMNESPPQYPRNDSNDSAPPSGVPSHSQRRKGDEEESRALQLALFERWS